MMPEFFTSWPELRGDIAEYGSLMNMYQPLPLRFQRDAPGDSYSRDDMTVQNHFASLGLPGDQSNTTDWVQD